MKSIILKSLILLGLIFAHSCKAQTKTDYINFYNSTISSLNPIIPNKTQYYNQPFSNFYNILQNKNLNVKGWIYDTKISPSNQYYKLTLFFCDIGMLSVARENSFQHPIIIIIFENEIPVQVKALMEQYGATWNPTIAQFFSNLKIEKIDFIGVKGYNNNDYSE